MSRPTLIYYSEDAGDVYGFWQWVDGRRSEPRSFRIDRATLTPLLRELREALPTALPGESVVSAIRRMRTVGSLTSRSRERILARTLSETLIPPALAAELGEEFAATGTTALLRMLPAPSLAAVPWEALLVGDDARPRRLVELVDIVADAPLGVHAGRSRLPEPWSDAVASRPSVHIVDPGAPSASSGSARRVGAVLAPSQRRAIAERHPAARLVSTRAVTRSDLSAQLRAHPAPSRLFYIGHVVSPGRASGATSLLLSDDESMYGVLPVYGGRRPFSALDALEGTMFADRRLADAGLDGDDAALAWPTGRREALPGPDIWPMPPRVALIACTSGGDLEHAEPFGLAIAFINAGAEIVTASRWALPTDLAFRDSEAFRPDIDPQPLLDMALAVDSAHVAPDPVAAIASWQRERAAEWDSRDDAADWLSPVTWAALTTFSAPARSVLPLTADEASQIAADD
ncbi:CHAT domain-containing protein [Microbacterium sp. SLBN-146]|uniref:CHAT domain-containing protein n=1 Tax=Microbacterium sp. SLBN-146 TaxID=2768457 RepID=UPI00135AA1E6|nr:CHAT domain-containing protein [Microbacterium sp. SLBN-146]